MPDVVIVLDTSTLLRLTHEPQLLSQGAADMLARADRESLVISAISLWEIGTKVRAGRLRLGMTLEAYVFRVQQQLAIRVEPVTAAIAMRSATLDWSHRDPADRIIVATAGLGAYTLVTSDRVIRDWYPQAHW
jgi:PIN domain nuclease of toxin-antitoxin system